MAGERTVGDLIREHRLRVRMTQRELAERAGMSVRAVRDIEHGRVVRPQRSSVHRLARALGLAGPEPDAELTALRPPAVTTPAQLWLAVLGPLLVRRGNNLIEVVSTMQATLLGLLAVQSGQVVPTDEIVDVLWGDEPPSSCLRLVHTYVGQVRALLEPERPRRSSASTVRRIRGGYRLDLSSSQLDLAGFDDLVNRARTAEVEGDAHAALESLAEALGCWRGPVLAGVGGRLRQHPAVVAAGGRRLAAALAYGDLALDLGRFDDAVSRLRVVLHGEPLHEGLAARLMLALAGCGAQAAALELFADVRGRLADELAIDPGPELLEAHRRVLRGQLSAATLRTSRAAPPRPAQLPADVTAFTGRATSLRQLDSLLAPEPPESATAVVIAAITGIGGVGKTALAVHWSYLNRDRAPDGQLYVNLRGYSQDQPRPAIEAVAGFLRAVGVPAEQIPADLDEAAALYRSALADKRMLILLDNAVTAEQVRPLLPGSPGSLVLITSRDRLSGLVAEQGVRRITLDPFSPQEAAALLAAMLGAARVKREPVAAAHLAQLCGYLPLALRVAAANVLNRPRAGIADCVADLRADDRLGVLAATGDVQTTVCRTFDLSYAALDEPAQRLFRLLGLLPGPDVDVVAAASLAGVEPSVARALLDKLAGAHLVQETALGRFALHDLLRRYARQRVAGDPARESALLRLLDHYCRGVRAAAEWLYPQMPQPAVSPVPTAGIAVAFADRSAARDWLDVALPGLTAAVRYCADLGPSRHGWWLGYALRGYFDLGRDVVSWEGVANATLVAAQRDGACGAVAAAEHNAAHLDYCRGRYAAADSRLERALVLARRAGWDLGERTILSCLGALRVERGQMHRAERYLRAAMGLARRLGDPAGEANSLDNLGEMYWQQGRLKRAVECYQAAIPVYRRVPCDSGEAHTLTGLSAVARVRGQFWAAARLLERALALYRSVGNRVGEVYAGCHLAALHLELGELGLAAHEGTAALERARETADGRGEAAALSVLGAVGQRRGRLRDADLRYRRAIELAVELHTPYPEAEALVGLAAVTVALGHCGLALRHVDDALRIGHSHGFQLLVADAHAVGAEAALPSGDFAAARKHAESADRRYRAAGHRLGSRYTSELLRRTAPAAG